MKIVLATPPLAGGGARPRPAHKMRYGMLPPLGLLHLAGVLIRDGHGVEVIDAPFHGHDEQSLARAVMDLAPDVFGLSVMSPNFPNACNTAAALRGLGARCKIVMGGPHPTGFPVQTLERAAEVDAVVEGEGELVFPRLVRAWESGADIAGIPSVCWRGADRGIIRNQPCVELVDLDALPLPARELLPVLSYAPEPMENKRLPSTSMIASRGCLWARCAFCFRSGSFWRRYRVRSPRRTVDEAAMLARDLGFREIVFYDDDLLANKQWVLEFCELLDREELDLVWTARGRVSQVDFEVLERVRDSGCSLIEFGYESGSQELLDRIDKGITLDDSRRAAQWCRELGIDVFGTFILGLPGETPELGEATVRFALELDPEYAAFIPCHPFEGTELYEDAQRSGTMVKPPYSERMESTRYVPSVSFVPEGYADAEQLERLWKDAYRRFYFRPGYILRHMARIRSPHDVRRYYEGLKLALGLSYR